MDLLVGWACVVAAVGFLFDYLERTLKDEARRGVAQWISEYPRTDPSTRVRQLASAFIAVFDSIYRPRGSRLPRLLWASLAGALVSVVLLSVFYHLTPGGGFRPETALLFALVMVAVLLTLFCALAARGWRRHVLLLVAGALPFGAVVFILGLYPYSSVSGSFWGMPLMWWYFAALAGTAVMVLLARREIRVSPVRAFASSFVALLIAAALFPGHAREFVSAVLEEPRLLAFVGLNLIADSFSLLETYYVLRLARRARPWTLAFLMMADLALSACIFCVLPFVLGELTTILHAASFGGERPWLGLMFWSTFFTSAMFYVFVASSLLAVVLKAVTALVSRARAVLPFEEHPVRALGVVAMLLVTVCFLVAGVLR